MYIFKRQSIRLKAYDYSAEGLYFITLVCQDRKNLFGEIREGIMHLNVYGKIATEKWLETPLLRPNVSLGAYVIMPNHLHGIVSIDQSVRANCIRPQITSANEGCTRHSICSSDGVRANCIRPTNDNTNTEENNTSMKGECNSPQRPQRTQVLKGPSQTIGAIVRGYKGSVQKAINEMGTEAQSLKVWQRNYYEHIIRTPEAYENIHHYILHNPLNWKEDTLR